VTPVNYLAI